MNENLKIVWNKAASSHIQESTSWATQQNFLIRFAELIVEECGNISDKGEPYKSKELMKKYFGFK